MSRTIINVQAYGDFDIPTSRLIMEAPGFIEEQAVAGIIAIVKKENAGSDNTNEVIKQLKSLGFTACRTIDLTIGGDL